jgi:hypothetical protein
MLGRVVCMLALIAIVPGFVIWGIADHTPLTRTSDYCVVSFALIAAGTALAVGCGHGLLRRPHFFYLSQHRVGVARLFGHLLADPLLATAVSMYANKADAVNWMVAAFAISAAATYFAVEHAAYRVHQRRRESLKSHDPQERRSWGCYAIGTYLAMVFFFVLVWWTALDGPADLHEAEQMEGRPWWQLLVKSTARALGTASIVVTVFRALNLLVSVLCVYSKTEQRLGGPKQRPLPTSPAMAATNAATCTDIPCAIDVTYNYVAYEVVDLMLFCVQGLIVCAILGVELAKRKAALH